MSFIKLTSSIHDNQENNRVLINPWEISSVCPHREGGAIVVTKKGFTYKVLELVEEIEDQCRDVMTPKRERDKWNDDKSHEEISY